MSLLLRKSLSQAKFCLPGGRKRIPRTSVSSSFPFPFLNAEFSLVCGIPFFFLFLFLQKQKSRRRTEKRGRDSLLQKIHQGKDRVKTKRKAKIREKTKNEKELRLRNIVRDAFFSSLDRSFSSPSSRKKDKEKGAHQPSFFSSVTKGKKENAPRMKDGIRRKGDRRKKRKKEKGGEKGAIRIRKKEKREKTAAFRKTPRFRLYGIFGEKGRNYRIDVISLLVA